MAIKDELSTVNSSDGAKSPVQDKKAANDKMSGNSSKKSSKKSKDTSSSGTSTTGYDFNIGDEVRIKPGGKDVTNGVEMKKGWKYCSDGGSLWGTVTKIVKDWNTGSKYGLPAKVVKVVINQGSTVIWQVQPQDVSPKVIRKSTPEEEKPVTKKPDKPKKDKDKAKEEKNEKDAKDNKDKKKKKEKTQEKIDQQAGAYAPTNKSKSWQTGRKTGVKAGIKTKVVTKVRTKIQSKQKDSAMLKKFFGDNYDDITLVPTKIISGSALYKGDNIHPENKVPSTIRTPGMLDDRLGRLKQESAWDDPSIQAEMKNQDTSKIQNANKFPYQLSSTGTVENPVATYDYSFIPGDTRYNTGKSSFSNTFESRMATLRQTLGLPVHGSQERARSMKMYLYNRFKAPDPNMAHNKSFVHVFFTRPDCNLLKVGGGVVDQVANHTDTAILWRKYPELFKMLSDYNKCDDDNNFNFLLSNQITSFSVGNEGLNTVNVGKSWGEHEMIYGEGYNGRTSGEFTCTFDETNDYSIINLMKLWVTYIANVSDGSWSPYYPDFSDDKNPLIKEKDELCHVYDKALDYAASVYVFWVGADGEDVLYWTKYYGVFPSVNGADALSWTKNGSPNETPKLSITFKYCYKRDANPMALLTFNQNANIKSSKNKEIKYLNAYDFTTAGTAIPFVGAPFIELNIPNELQENSDDVYTGPRASIRLKFRKPSTGASKFRSKKNLYQVTSSATDVSNAEKDEDAADEKLAGEVTGYLDGDDAIDV